ncbi:MAG TPA: endonuclease/exonuclease/phosphatase family protein [Hanamia sp.]|nr:endonuclease/exonuclease/phosphatase family protein [Hanamia sp.]
MKLKRVLFVALLMFSLISLKAQIINVATYNMRNDNNSEDSTHGNGWKQRFPVIASLIQFHGFDIFGTQELLHHQIQDLRKLLPGYSFYGIGRDDGKQAGEFSEIFYKKDKFQLLGHGDFWLSQTPDKPSLGWDATCCNRICSWVLLKDKKSGKKFYVFNTHYDYQKDLARNESSKLILKEIKRIAGTQPAIFMGDLNGGNETSWYKSVANSGFLKDTYKEAKNPYALNGSFNGFGSTIKSDEIIDHIFISKQFSVQQWGILTDTYHGKYPSDHFPVMAKLKM